MSDDKAPARKTGLLIGVIAVVAFVFLAVTMVGACNEGADLEDQIAPGTGALITAPLLPAA